MWRRLSLLFVLTASGVASAAEDPADAAPELRKALLERATAPASLARLPTLGVDPLRTATRALSGPLAAAAFGAAPPPFATRAREAADRAANRATAPKPDDHRADKRTEKHPDSRP